MARLDAEDPRAQEVNAALVKHLHAFIRDIEPTEKEWGAAIDFLTRTGQKCDDKRQEFILLSDVLGVSMLVDAINHRSTGGVTETTVTGPFHAKAFEKDLGDNIAEGPEWETGDHTLVRGRVTDTNGNPIANAKLDVWQADDDGSYDLQSDEQPDTNLRGIFRTNENGEYWFRTIKPAEYPVPTDGPVGEILNATGRHPMRPAHIHYWVSAEGHEGIITHVFVEGDEYLESDAVFGVKDSLVAPFVPNTSEAEAEKHGFRVPFYELEFNFVLRPLS